MINEKTMIQWLKKPNLAKVGNEDLFYIVGWLLVFTIPLTHNYYEYSIGQYHQMQWGKVINDCTGDLMFLILFFLSKFFLEPFFFFRQKFRSFVLLSVLSAFVVMFGYSFIVAMRQETIEQPVTLLSVLLGGRFVSMFTMALLVTGTSLCINIVFRNRKDQLMKEVSEAEKVKTELDYLKYQINPHFFMNTLNNIHALVDIDGQMAKDAIIELSRMMRYLLYETGSPTIQFSKELEFHRHFVHLMRLRCDESVKISYTEPDLDASYLNVQVTPLIGIIFIENAFKYGISHRQPSYITINYEKMPDNFFHFHCANSNFSNEGVQKKGRGLGLVNVRKRLDLMYQDRYKLDIISTEKDFIVDLYVPI